MHELVSYLVAGQTPGATWCNQATKIIARDVGAPWEGPNLLDNSADAIVESLRGMENDGAYRAVDAETAQTMANDGFFVIAGASSAELGAHHGHIATVRPLLTTDATATGYIAGGSGPLVNHIGVHVWITRLSKAFGSGWQQVTFHTPRVPYGA
jgi:hypothetical protein